MLLFSGTHPGLFLSILHLRAHFVQSSACSDVTCSCDVSCSICNVCTYYLCINYMYTDSTCTNRGLGGYMERCSSRWVCRADRALKPAAQASLLAPAVKLLLSRACDLIQMRLTLIRKTERLISRMGVLDLLRKGKLF